MVKIWLHNYPNGKIIKVCVCLHDHLWNTKIMEVYVAGCNVVALEIVHRGA